MPLIPKQSVIGVDSSSNPFYRDVVSVVNLDGSPISSGSGGSGGATTETPMASIVDSSTSSGYVYFLQAAPGTSVATAAWQVSRLNTTTGQTMFANGNANYTNYGTGYSALTFS